jgi:zinc protease
VNATASARPPRPAQGPVREYHFPAAERSTLGNGLTVVVAPIPRLPIATVLAVTDAGAVWDTPGREGLAQLVAKLMPEGAGQLEGAELAEAFERLGATMESSADWDAAVFSMTVTSAHLAPAFALFADVLRHPVFREREIERLKAERLAELLQLRAEPRGLADEAFGSAIYDTSSRYAIAEGGTEETVDSVSSDDVTSLYARRYAPGTTTLIVAGDVTPATVMQLAKKHLGDWAGSAERGKPSTDRPARTTRAMHLIAKTDAPQSELRIGHVGVPRAHPDYFDIVVMNAIFGGLFNSRVNMNLREEHAYTYGAFSAFDWRRGAGPFVVSTAVKTDATADSIREVVKEIERMRAEPVASDELSLATSYLDGVFPIRFETTAAVAGSLANQVVYQLPRDYFDSYRSHIRAVTADSVLRAAQRHLDPTRLQIVVVGDATALQGQLEDLAFGPLVVDPER